MIFIQMSHKIIAQNSLHGTQVIVTSHNSTQSAGKKIEIQIETHFQWHYVVTHGCQPNEQ